ncbi:nephrocystin-4 isoform X2 [Corythoichthys intestinalis]|uniref:nephrocystin-4 isoform X2 n=1 Tax=Corythoichthys intestinalis TaxID=161448 RepID=UPI0025A6313D|nr:nephrocystin-4 isoform X2 [Corythoichthys intestinalis]
MVKTEKLLSLADGWEEVFERGRMIPPPGPMLRQSVDSHLSRSYGFQLAFKQCAAPHVPMEKLEAAADMTFQLRVTFFDRNYQYFFGRTWKSVPQKMKNNKITLDEILYFHTSLRMPSTVLILELVALAKRSDGSQLALGEGFAVLDLPFNKTEPHRDRRLNLLHGSPRVLLHPLLKDVVDYSDHLKTIDEAHLECTLKGHSTLAPMMHLLPENVLVSRNENIPGLAPSPTGDRLLKPALLKMLPFTLSRLTICLQPSLEVFESQLLQLINADCQNTQPDQEGSLKMVAIQERRLHVGVHNGWCFIDTPQIMVLELLTTGSKGRGDSISKRNTLNNDSLSSSLLPPPALGLRSNLELMLINHRAVAVVFQLEYVFSAPFGQETMLSAMTTSRAAFLQCLRWAILCPFEEQKDWKGEETQLLLQGGSKPNPLGVMVYNSAASLPTSGAIQDTIGFRLSPSEDKTTSSPKTPQKTNLQDAPHQGRSSSSSTQSLSDIQAVSSPESPQGPKLSLSQLTAPSRNPTISCSGLPWQQSFPSLLHPVLRPPAQWPSHDARSPSVCAQKNAENIQAETCSDVSNIAHLEMDLQPVRDGTNSAKHNEAPVNTGGVAATSLSTVSSRGSLAHLYSVVFPDIVDSKGQAADVLNPAEPVPFDLRSEEMDPQQENLLLFQFLAFTRIPVEGIEAEWPINIHFTFQFYRFPPVTTQQLRLLSSDKVQQKASELHPCVLTSINNDGTLNSESPGLQVQFRVDHSFLKTGEKCHFLHYLALHTMRVDIWDSDSLLLIGSTAIELKCMLRHGKTAVQALHDLDILTSDDVGEETLAVQAFVRGLLHVRTGNIGSQAYLSRSGTADRLPFHSHIIIPREVTGGFTGGSLSTRNIPQLNERNTAQAQRLQVQEEGGPLYRGKICNDAIFSGEGSKFDSGRRKLECMAAVYQKEAQKEASKTMHVTDVTKDVYLDEQPYESSFNEDINKEEGIRNMLCQTITTPYNLFASLGSAEYMEFVLKNPFNWPQTITIRSNDPELSVITKREEWQYFKKLNKIASLLKEDIFRMEEGSPSPKVYLRAKESVHIPLKYQSFLCDHNMTIQGPSVLPPSKSLNVAKKILSNLIAAKTIKILFEAENGDPIAICEVTVEPLPHIVHQTVRLYHPEHCFLKKAIQLPHWHMHSAVGDTDAKMAISARCSDPNVCQTRKLVPGEPQDLHLKIPGGPNPNIKMFFVMVFTDKWMAAPSQIWQIYVHFMERVDVSCIAGQRSCQSLVLRGWQAARKVKCFSSHPREIEVNPGGVFMLPSAGLQELQVMVQPWHPGTRFLYVNAVDVERRQLVTAWLLCLNVLHPVLSKAFEVCVPLNEGRGTSKKITYANPYTSSRTFLLHSDRPDLLQFKENKFQLHGGESYSIGLRFAPSLSAGSVEILVYVNNLEEKTEETFCLKVTYS